MDALFIHGIREGPVMHLKINKHSLLPFLLYNQPIAYHENIVLSPVTMKDVIAFQIFSPSITVRKNSIFSDKAIIKMPYLNFLKYCHRNTALEKQYGLSGLSEYFTYAVQLLQLCCKDAKISYDTELFINDIRITPEIFDDLRRIIIIQNEIDFDIDEFMNYDTEKKLLKAKQENHKNEVSSNIEDYIDSLIIAMNTTENQIMNMTIRKFWRYIKRYRLHEYYTIAKTGECSGMVSFKEPLKYWMMSLEEDDKYEDVKTDENELRGKIG